MINPETDAVVSFSSEEQKNAFAKWMKGDGATEFYNSLENKELGSGCMEHVEVETEEDGGDYVLITIE